MAPRETRIEFYRLNVGVAGFLAGIMFAAMSMLIGSFEGMKYGDILVALTAVDCVLFTLFAFGSVKLASVRGEDAGHFALFVQKVGEIAMWLFLVIVPLLTLQVTHVGFVAVLAVEAVFVALYIHMGRGRGRDSAG